MRMRVSPSHMAAAQNAPPSASTKARQATELTLRPTGRATPPKARWRAMLPPRLQVEPTLSRRAGRAARSLPGCHNPYGLGRVAGGVKVTAAKRMSRGFASRSTARRQALPLEPPLLSPRCPLQPIGRESDLRRVDMRMSQSRTARRLSLAVAAVGLAPAAAPAMAQTYYTVPEVVVTPERLGPDGRPETLSRVVNIADLDLRYDRDVREMQRRVRTTARQICDDLGERDVLPSVERNCVNDAVRRTDYQMRTAIAQARSSTYYAYAAP